MPYVIDRIEGQYAVCEKENGEMINIPLKKIKGNFKEGYILLTDGDNFKIDKKLTVERQKYINQMTDDIWK
ncbi:DUF3006 domain-containing protein [Clostridium sp. BJN0001]|uniref:DUF3006 domain-containing protein n=1 Tax=Clostridium sp. BJN0001 TaxID=2930219 RepID=UPI001FD34084|nr:DUF3006 domain-containing protein [Clostridium sp. BJN0001]